MTDPASSAPPQAQLVRRLGLTSAIMVVIGSIIGSGIFLTLSGTYDQLFTYVVFAGWIFYALGAAGVFILRKKFPRQDRPYRVPGYPLVPLLFVGVATWFVINTLINQTADSMVGLLLLALGLPFYFYWKRTMLRQSP